MGLLEFPVVNDENELAVILPQQKNFVPLIAPQVPEMEARFHRFVFLRHDGDSWLAESLLDSVRVRLMDLTVMQESIVRRALDGMGFFAQCDSESGTANWDFHELVAHTNSRQGWHRDAFSAPGPVIGEIESPPARRSQWPGKSIQLSLASGNNKATFSSVLQRRQSQRNFDDTRPIDAAQLGTLLDRAARSRASQVVRLPGSADLSVPLEIVRRPYPAAGGLHELEIYPVVRLCKGLEPGMYHYDSWNHELTQIPADPAHVMQILKHAGFALQSSQSPQVLLVIAARFSRVFYKYKAIGYGNILRNTGALLQTLHLATTELEMAASAVGAADSLLFARATGLDPFEEGSVGEFAVGSRLPD